MITITKTLRPISGEERIERLSNDQLIGAYRHMEACRALLNVPNDEVLYAEIEKLLEFAQMVARSACLDQRTGDECHCFSCEAKRLITRQGPDYDHRKTR